MRNETVQTEGKISFTGRWDASRAERIADGVVHLIGIVAAIAAGSILLALSFSKTGPGEFAAAVLYVAALLSVLSISFIYNMWPLTPAKWILRRFDHSMIYVLIAASYTPFLVQLPDHANANLMLAGLWMAAGAGMALKILMPGRLDRLAIAFYLLTGWSGLALANPLIETLPQTTVTLIVAGGVVYTAGVIFYVWRSLRFQTALWHLFVVIGAGLHCAAVIDSLVLNRF
jgi:hemolysin III